MLSVVGDVLVDNETSVVASFNLEICWVSHSKMLIGNIPLKHLKQRLITRVEFVGGGGPAAARRDSQAATRHAW